MYGASQVAQRVKESICNAGNASSILEAGRSPGEGHGNPLQCSCLENPLDRGAMGFTVHRITKSQTRLKLLSSHRRGSSLCG